MKKAQRLALGPDAGGQEHDQQNDEPDREDHGQRQEKEQTLSLFAGQCAFLARLGERGAKIAPCRHRLRRSTIGR